MINFLQRLHQLSYFCIDFLLLILFDYLMMYFELVSRDFYKCIDIHLYLFNHENVVLCMK